LTRPPVSLAVAAGIRRFLDFPGLACLLCGMTSDWSLPVGRVTDAHGHSWRIGTEDEVAWIAAGTSPNQTITSAIPPVFDAYATVVLPDNGADQELYNRAMLATLAGQSPGLPTGPPWWLGYLHTSDFDMVSPGVAMAQLPKVALYAEWDYVLVEAGPEQAATWRRTEPKGFWWDDALPELMFPADRSWLVSTLTDDDWTCVGGPAPLVDRLLAHPDLQARRVQLDEEATPPGHRAF
jgi:hypothetical protein